MFMNKNELLYTAYYCEENIWHLCNNSEIENFEKNIVVISNVEKKCALFYQKINQHFPNIPVVWDYHVILLVFQNEWLVYDFDTILSFPVKLEEYLHKTFQNVENYRYQPYFRIITKQDYLTKFSSDRSHMFINRKWTHTPPQWKKIINGSSNFTDIINFKNDFIGQTLNFTSFKKKYCNGF